MWAYGVYVGMRGLGVDRQSGGSGCGEGWGDFDVCARIECLVVGFCE